MANQRHASAEKRPLSENLPIDDVWLHCILPRLSPSVVVRMYRLSRRWREVALSGITKLRKREDTHTRSKIRHIPAMRLPNLRELDTFTPVEPEVCAFLTNLRKLTVHQMSAYFATGLPMLINLEYLSVSMRLRETHAPHCLQGLTKLRYLETEVFPPRDQEMPHLETLVVAFNSDTEHVPFSGLDRLTSLTKLHLKCTKNSGVRPIPVDIIRPLTKLETLLLEYKIAIDDEEGTSPPLHFPELRSLCLSSSNIGSRGTLLSLNTHLTSLAILHQRPRQMAELLTPFSASLKTIQWLETPGYVWGRASEFALFPALRRIDAMAISVDDASELNPISTALVQLTDLREIHLTVADPTAVFSGLPLDQLPSLEKLSFRGETLDKLDIQELYRIYQYATSSGCSVHGVLSRLLSYRC